MSLLRWFVLGGLATSLSLACSAADTADVNQKEDGVKSERTKKDDPAETTPTTETTPPPAAAGACNATTCAAGCCVNDQCQTDHTVAHCATGGVACPAPCAAGACVSQNNTFACSGAVAASYKVTLVRAIVAEEKDVYINSGAFGTLEIKRTETKDGVKVASFNVDLGTVTGANLVGMSVSAEVKHDKFLSDETLGHCNYKVAAADVAAAKVVVTKTSGCDGIVNAVEFALTPVP